MHPIYFSMGCCLPNASVANFKTAKFFNSITVQMPLKYAGMLANIETGY